MAIHIGVYGNWIPDLYDFEESVPLSLKVPLTGPRVALPTRVPAIKQDPVLRNTCGPTAGFACVRRFIPQAIAFEPNEFGIANDSSNVSFAIAPRQDAPSSFYNDPRGIAAAIQKRGLFAKVERGFFDLQSLQRKLWACIAAGEPVIVNRVQDGHDPRWGHYTVIDGVDVNGVHMMDPWPDSSPYKFVPWGVFCAQFNNRLNPGGVIIRVSQIPIVM